jgi:ABC-type sugar transport system ATPase subunit
MHFVDGHLGSDSGMITWESVLGSLPAPSHWQGLQTGQASLTLGIRPEDLLLERQGSSQVMMRVVLVEALGYANLITLERAGWQAIARTDGKYCPASGDVVPVQLRLENAHLFDSTGKSLKFAYSTA